MRKQCSRFNQILSHLRRAPCRRSSAGSRDRTPAGAAVSAQQPVYQAAPADNNPAALKVSQFFWLDFLTGIPLVGFILTLVWGFGGDVNENKRNYCRAKLVWLLIGIAVTVIFTIIAVAGGGLAALIYEQY